MPEVSVSTPSLVDDRKETCNSCGEEIPPLARRCDKCGCCDDCCNEQNEIE